MTPDNIDDVIQEEIKEELPAKAPNRACTKCGCLYSFHLEFKPWVTVKCIGNLCTCKCEGYE